MVPRTTTRRSTGVVHEHCDLAEIGIDAFLQTLHLLHLADISGHRENARGRELFCGSVERLLAQIGEANFHAECREPLCRRKADPAGTPGDHRGPSLCKCRMLWHAIAPIAGAIELTVTFFRCAQSRYRVMPHFA